MNYDKNQFRDFFNQLTLELQGRHGEQVLREFQNRSGCSMLEPTLDSKKLQGRKQLLGHLNALAPLIRFILAQIK